jgi:predicted CXXCH cytochrome family protein
MQSAVRQLGTGQEMNYASDGPTFVPAIWSRPYTDFDRKAFYKDERFRETTFLVQALRRSACYRRGTVQCATCHDPHPVDAGTYPVPLNFRDNPDELCFQCHSALRSKLTAHTHHAEASEGSRCVSCHMPRIVNALMFKARSHQIDAIPRTDLTERFGQDDSPNACLLCHQEKNPAWVQAKLQSW